MENEILSPRELRRYKPQIGFEGIGQAGQEKIKLAKILVIGAGGKGTSTLKTLITAGTGTIGICDDTLVDEETLGRQSLYGDNDIGKQKAIVSKQYLKARNQFADIKVHNIRLSPDNLSKIIENYDILIDATNNYPSHYAISNAAQLFNKPLVFSSTFRNKAIVTVLEKSKGKSIGEIIPDENRLETGNENIFSPSVVTNAFTGIILANEAIKIVLGHPSALHANLLIFDASDYTFTLLPK
ncbi:MAG: HesA/MoeB/ThiF family protein [Bacteroidales bacterium]|nr:HesA/MoeB/ThiF family protein [Bacteroidales bacterium]